MSILVPEIPSLYGALDSAAFADGEPSDAALLRPIVTGSNRAACIGAPIVQYIFDASSDLGESSGRCLFWGLPYWFQIAPGPIRRVKMPGLTKGKVFVNFTLRNGEVCHLQVHTSVMPFDPSRQAGDPNVLTLTGTGSEAWAELADIPIQRGDTDHVTFWLRGVPTATAGSVANHAGGTGLNTGSIDSAYDSTLNDSSGGWNRSDTQFGWDEGGHAVLITSGGNQITRPRQIVGVPNSGQLTVYPPFEPGDDQRFRNETYSIVELPQGRINNIALYAQDRTA